MKHYDKEKLYLYKQDKCTFDEANEIEEHLKKCDQCLHNFLSLIDEEEIKKAENLISLDFEEKVLNKIQAKKLKSRQKNKNMFVYYAAAAILTLAFTGIGIFDALVNVVPEITKEAVVNEEKIVSPGQIMNLTQKITNKTSYFINNFQINNKKEEWK